MHQPGANDAWKVHLRMLSAAANALCRLQAPCPLTCSQSLGSQAQCQPLHPLCLRTRGQLGRLGKLHSEPGVLNACCHAAPQVQHLKTSLLTGDLWPPTGDPEWQAACCCLAPQPQHHPSKAGNQPSTWPQRVQQMQPCLCAALLPGAAHSAWDPHCLKLRLRPCGSRLTGRTALCTKVLHHLQEPSRRKCSEVHMHWQVV